jgi:hypothetical protein
MENLKIGPSGIYGRDIYALWDVGVITPSDANRLEELRQLGNVASHEAADNITSESALDFADAVEIMMVNLKDGEERYRSGQGPAH